MGQHSLRSRVEVVEKKHLTIDKFKETLKGLCDEDFNGNNGEEYYITVENENGEKVLKSRFDTEWDELVDDTTNPLDEGWSIAEIILSEAYSYDKDYYVDYFVEVVNTQNEIVIFISYMDYI